MKELGHIHQRLRACRKCPAMQGTAVHGPAIAVPVMLVGQAPGAHEGVLGRPFAYTAGKTLFQWLKSATGLDEAQLREHIYFSAVARCFPGKANGSGDREPSAAEIANCREHLVAEVRLLRPRLVVAVGRLAITEVLGKEIFGKQDPLTKVVGSKFLACFHGHEVVVIPLPHPSGVSRWPVTEPGKTKLSAALGLVSACWEEIFPDPVSAGQSRRECP